MPDTASTPHSPLYTIHNCAMHWQSIPPSMPRWVLRHPLTLTAALSGVNRLRKLFSKRRSVIVAAVTALVGALLLALFLSVDSVGLAMRQTLNYSALVVSVSALYAASLMSRRRRTIAAERARSWLIATPLVSQAAGRTLLLTMLPLLWRLAVAATLVLLLGLNPTVSIEQALRLGTLIALGATVGGPCGWWLSRRAPTRSREHSRYTLRLRHGTQTVPSGAALSHWPIAQAFAWGRPENARFLLGAAVLTVPGGTGILGALSILVAWTVASYLGALLVAIPHVGRAASQWLRSTPITFRDFAWPLARRALLHQALGTLAGMGVMWASGVSPATAMYLGAVWLTVVVLTAAVGLADGYRGRSPAAKTLLSTLTVLLVDQRVHGLGISIAAFLAILHLRIGARHART
jgi:hypothetical protein